MEKLIITSIESPNVMTALGISETKIQQIEEVLNEINELTAAGHPKSLTEVAAYVSQRIDLNVNEIFYFGFELAQMAIAAKQQESIMAAMMSSMRPVAEA